MGLPEKVIIRREQMLLAIEVHGPNIVYQRAELFREITRTDKWGAQQVRFALIEHGMEPAEVDDLTARGHLAACACWRCVLRLHKAVRRSQGKLTQRAEHAKAAAGPLDSRSAPPSPSGHLPQAVGIEEAPRRT